VEIINALLKSAKRSKKKEPKIAILTPYKAQKRLVEELMEKIKLKVIVSTINESQGKEKAANEASSPPIFIKRTLL